MGRSVEGSPVRRVLDELGPRGIAWRLASFVAGAVLGFVVFLGIALGACHGGGGFCSGEFGAAHVEAFTSALVASVFVGPLLVLPFTRRRSRILVSGLAGFAVTGVIVLIAWP